MVPGMGAVPEISVLVPTRGRPGILSRLIAALREQHGAPPFEVLVGIDGADAGERAAVDEAAGGLEVRVSEGEQSGPAVVRNRLIDQARAPTLLLLNDDVVPDPDLLAVHARDQAALGGRPAMILGDAPFAVGDRDRLFDRLVRETSMVFFYDQMPGAQDPERDWGFRHAWTLNLSLPTRVLREVGGFCGSLPGAAFEDLEMAWRVRERFGAPVLYRPAARVVHHHWYEPDAYLAREEMLGRDALALAAANPECALETFRRDVAVVEEVERCARLVEDGRDRAELLRQSFRSLADRPADAAGSALEVREFYERHLPLKRWHWARGLLAAACEGGAQSAA